MISVVGVYAKDIGGGCISLLVIMHLVSDICMYKCIYKQETH